MDVGLCLNGIGIKVIQAASDDVSEPKTSAETPNVKFRSDPPARKADALTGAVGVPNEMRATG